MKIAVVTGANKGIGLAIVEKLCKTLGSDWHVYLTARNEERGLDAVKSLKSKGYAPYFHQLDLEDSNSSTQLAAFIKEKYGGLDILINNAGMAYKQNSTAPVAEQAEVTVRTNFWGTLQVCEALFPLLRPHARVVHVSSGVAFMSYHKASPELQQKLRKDFTLDQLKQLMTEFVDAAKENKIASLGWMPSTYGASKVGQTLLCQIQAKQIKSSGIEDVLVNACCPGYVDTDMTSHKGTKTVEQGCDTPVFLATELPAGGPNGSFFAERKELIWGESVRSFT